MAELPIEIDAGPYRVVGLARSGAAIASVLAERGETVIGVDSGAPEEAAGLEQAGVEVSLGVDGTRQLERARTLVKSPGVPQDAAVVAAARERGIEVTGELELSWRLIPNAFCAVSGTNGCDYCIASHRAAAVSKGMTEAMFGEFMSIVGVANMNNRLANGFQVPVDDKFK